MSILVLLLLLWQPGNLSRTESAQMRVESGGKFWKVGSGGDRGLWQCTEIGWVAAGMEAGLPAAAARGEVWRSLHVLVHVPSVGLAARRLVMRRWGRRSRGERGPALRAYNCGNRGLRRECGDEYLRRLRAAGASFVYSREAE